MNGMDGKRLSELKVGIVGCGFIAKKRHIPCFLGLGRNVVVRAVCDLNQSLATSAAKEFDIPIAYSDLSEMLRKESLDIVDICTPPQTHAAIAIEAMERDCHVILEKPMALKVSDCDQMNNVARKSGSKLCVVHNELFRPPLLKSRQLVAEGDIGKLVGMRWCRLTSEGEYMALKDHWVHRLPGGVLGETGPHAVYTSLAFLKSVKDADIHAMKTLEYPWVLYDYYNITLEGERITSNAVISHSSDCVVADVELFGTEATLKLDLQSMLLIRYELKDTKPSHLALSSLGAAAQMVKGVMSNSAKVMLKSRGELFRALDHSLLIKEFVKSVIEDQPPPVTGEEGRDTVRIMELLTEKLYKRYDLSRNG
jgi:predicted dehydrogenase